MFWIILLFLLAAPVVVVAGHVSCNACTLHGRRMPFRVCSRYFWATLGLAYFLWLIFLEVIFLGDVSGWWTTEWENTLTAQNQNGGLMLYLMPYLIAVLIAVIIYMFWNRCTEQRQRCKHLWEIIMVLIMDLLGFISISFLPHGLMVLGCFTVATILSYGLAWLAVSLIDHLLEVYTRHRLVKKKKLL